MAITKLHDIHERRRSRNVGLAMVLGAFVILLMGLTVVKVTAMNPAMDPAMDPARTGQEAQN